MRKPTVVTNVQPPGGADPVQSQVKPSIRHRQTLHDAGMWANKEMGLGQTYQDYVDGKISAGEYLQKHMYVRAILHKASKDNRANPQLNISVVDHARRIHGEMVEKQRRAQEAAKKPKKKAKK